MSKNLVIVESPAKAKTIAKFLGKEFTVLSSIGHIRDIPTKKDKKGTPPIDVANHFATRYEVDTEKKKLITELKKAAKSSETVWLATDEDREGEAIAWHLCEVLSLDPKTTKRIVFHEITKTAIENAIKTPRTIDMDLVNAQQARRILDRLVGFDLSPIVQRKVPGGKSAGRVQSPAVRLLVEREREIQNFQATSTYKIVGRFITESNDTLDGELSFRADSKEQARLYLEQLVTANYNVKSTSTSPSSRNPGAPYTTSTLQQDAANKLGFSVKTTMSAAQKLYQSGKITYMRTDSVNLSKEALSSLGSYIKSSWGEDYYHFRTFKTKSASAQEAHEAIRPTDPSTEVASDDSYEQKLYTLIRARTLASQMTAAKLEKTTVVIAISTKEDVFEAKGEVILFDGFLKVYNFNKKEAGLLPAVNAEDILSAQYIEAKEIFARPPARFSEASLVKKLEELGIGRPSTYATIISTIQARGYAEKGSDEGEPRDISIITLSDGAISESITKEKTGSDKGKLIPTASGGVVSDFLGNHFNQVIDYGFPNN
jgi:DNA topoisomerase-1